MLCITLHLLLLRLPPCNLLLLPSNLLHLLPSNLLSLCSPTLLYNHQPQSKLP